MKIKVIKNIKPEVLIVAGVFAILCLYALSIGIRNIQFIFEQKKQIRLANEKAAQQPEIEVAQPTQSVRQTRYYESQPTQEIVYQPEQTFPEQMNVPEPVRQQPSAADEIRSRVRGTQWEQMANNLSDEELIQAQQGLQGMQSMVQIWQDMSPDEIAERQAQGMEMFQRFQTMSDSQRQEAMQQLQQQFQDWTQGDRQSLPDFTLPRDNVIIIDR